MEKYIKKYWWLALLLFLFRKKEPKLIKVGDNDVYLTKDKKTEVKTAVKTNPVKKKIVDVEAHERQFDVSLSDNKRYLLEKAPDLVETFTGGLRDDKFKLQTGGLKESRISVKGIFSSKNNDFNL